MEILNLSKNTVYSMLNNRIIPAYRVGNSKLWRINKCDFEDYLKSFNSYW
jgi:excisionase family DNA binding protein